MMSPETRFNVGVYDRLMVREAFVRNPDGDTQNVLYDQPLGRQRDAGAAALRSHHRLPRVCADGV